MLRSFHKGAALWLLAGTTVVVVASAHRGAALMHAFMGLPAGNGR